MCADNQITGQAEADVETESDAGSLPDWLINPREYKPVLPTTEEHTAAKPTVRKGQSMKMQEG